MRRENMYNFSQDYREIQRIDQQIAVEFQTARANQVYITRNRFVLPHQPPQPQGP
jgi:hypothetical protein